MLLRTFVFPADYIFEETLQFEYISRANDSISTLSMRACVKGKRFYEKMDELNSHRKLHPLVLIEALEMIGCSGTNYETIEFSAGIFGLRGGERKNNGCYTEYAESEIPWAGAGGKWA